MQPITLKSHIGFILFMKKYLVPLEQALTIVLVALASSQVAQAASITVLTLDSSRDPLSFTTNPGFSAVRGDLLNPRNFGASGVINREVEFLEPVSEITLFSLKNWSLDYDHQARTNTSTPNI